MIKVGIILTPQEGEAFVNHPSFTMLSTENSPYRFECLSDDMWVIHPNGVTLAVAPPINNYVLNKPA